MHHFYWKQLLVLGSAMLVMASAGAAPDPIPVKAFFQAGAFRQAALSPNGKYLAVLVVPPVHPDFLAVIDLATKTSTIVAQQGNSVERFAWVGDERLVYALDTDGWGTELRSVKRDGTDKTFLASSTRGVNDGPIGRLLLPWSFFNIDQCNRKNTDTIYVAHAEPDPDIEIRSVNMMRMNAATSRASTLPRPRNIKHWMIDQNGEPRIGVGSDGKQDRLITRDPGSEQWRTVKTFSTLGTFNGEQDAISPLAFAPDGTFYVVARGGRDTSAVYRYDLQAGTLDAAPLFATAGYDFDGTLVATCDKVLGVHFTTDAESIEWFDPAMKTLQQAVDKLLPATVNILSVPTRAEAPWMLVRAFSDVLAPRHYLFDSKSGTLEALGATGPQLEGKPMGRQQWLHYKARDGRSIPALLTLPPGKAKTGLPLVVLVHGGPQVRGSSWGWDSESQFLASRGYAVLEPAFRGSTGFGFAHMAAGWGQWGLAMQNDLADGARWTIAQGIVDPKRICIAGGSYGGYAAAMGLVNDPDLYRCAIDWAGVADLHLLYSGGWTYPSDMTDVQRQVGFKTTVGDPDRDSARMRATSPLVQAARITRPLLMAHGGRDWRVPVDHGTRLRDAVRGAGGQVEWVEYPSEGHGGWTLKTKEDFWGRAETFLNRHIGPATAP